MIIEAQEALFCSIAAPCILLHFIVLPY